MTVETRTSIEPSDVTAIEFECRICGTKIVLPIKSFDSPPISCSACKQHDRKQWLIPGSQDFADLNVLVHTVRVFSNTAKPNGFTLRLHLANSDPK
jgi:DNA replicative helicase MCM subunit Mcm2 (Cdc46/Mcm family)